MKRFEKNLLAVVLMVLLPLGAWALPFVPTLDPNATTNYWYYLKVDGDYCIASTNSDEISFTSSVNASNDRHLWCFVGSEETGYRVYNKSAKKYIVQDILQTEGPDFMTYEKCDENTFYLRYYDNVWTHSWYYLYQNIYSDQYGSMKYMDMSTDVKGVFSVTEAIAGTTPIIPDDPEWTRFDADGVGYGYIEGGNGAFSHEGSKNLIDGDTSSKFYGKVSNCWLTMKSSQPVVVKQYSIVTASDDREYCDRVLKSWKLQGSNDADVWQDIDVRENHPMPFANQQEVVFYVNDNRKFRFFKFMAAQAANGDNTQLSEVWINVQNHSWSSQSSMTIEPTCGEIGLTTRECSLCHARKWENVPSTAAHNFANGICSICGLQDNEVVLLPNGQHAPYMMKAYHGLLSQSGTTTPMPSAEWSLLTNYDDSQWMSVAMPTASYNHSGGPSKYLVYNSHWFGEYNYYCFRRVFNLPELNDNNTFTFRCVHDDNMIVYVNGNQVIQADGWTASADNATWTNCCESFDMPASNFKVGDNVVAVYSQQNWGGAYFVYDLLMRQNKASVAGDANGDGVVDIDDVNIIINMMLGKAETSPAGDANGDGSVDIDDVNAIINTMLGRE